MSQQRSAVSRQTGQGTRPLAAQGKPSAPPPDEGQEGRVHPLTSDCGADLPQRPICPSGTVPCVVAVQKTQNVQLARNAERCPVPPAAQALQSLDRVDYADAFHATLPAGLPFDAEGCARAALEGAWPGAHALGADGAPALPIKLWWALVGWRRAPRVSRRLIAGWKIGHKERNAIRLEASPRWGKAQIVSALVPAPAGGSQFVVATFLRFHGWIGRAAFLVIGPCHRRAVPFLLNRTAFRPTKWTT